MIRLRKEDFNDPHELARYAATANISLEEFQKQFYYLVESQKDNGDATDGQILQKAQTEDENLKKTPHTK